MSFNIGDYVISLHSQQVSIVIDKREGKGENYRTNVIIDSLGKSYTDDNTDKWISLSPVYVRLLTDLEKALI